LIGVNTGAFSTRSAIRTGGAGLSVTGARKHSRGLGLRAATRYRGRHLSRYILRGAAPAKPQKLADDKRNPPKRLRHELCRPHSTRDVNASARSLMAARRMRHHDAANRPERRPLAAVHFESRRRRPARWGLGSPGYRHWAAAAETDQCGRTTLALATECLAIAAVRHRALSARRAVFPVGYCSCPLNSKGPYLVRPSDGDDGSSISTMWHPIASGRDDDHLR
jgi:hypothetical protein